MNNRKFLAAVVSGSALALTLVPTSAWAQASTVQPPTPVDDEVGETDAGQPVDEDENAIIVTGFRASLENAVAEKRRSELIVESVTAEDIGKLPDNSIGEAIARLPGLTAQRLNGRANIVSIRGFGPDFSQTLLNGREQTSLGDQRAVEFDQYPAEVVNQVVVYKSPAAELVGQGLVGTIDIRTVRPLDYGRSVFAIGAQGSYTDLGKLNAGSEEFGYRASATFIDQFADDSIGVSLAASYIDEPYQIQEYNAWGFAQNDEGIALIGGNKSFVQSTQLQRLGLAGTVQFRASDNLTFTVDGFYSDFDDDQIRRGVELPLAFGGGFNVGFDESTFVVENDTVVAGTFNNVRGVVRNDVFQRQAKLYAGGFNALWEGDDGWSAYFDFGYSRTDRNELTLESYSGTGYNGDETNEGAAAIVDFTVDQTGAFFNSTVDYSDPSQIFLTDPLGWGGSRVQAGYYNNRIIDDELMQYRVHVEKEIDSFISAVKFGMNYTNRDKSLTPDEAFITLGGDEERSIPSEFLLRPTDLTYLGLGPIVSYDPRDLIDAGVLELEFRDGFGPGDFDVLSKFYNISEDLMTLYLQADVEQELGAGLLTGNFGVQAISTDQSSDGFASTPNGPITITRGDSYWDVLPSLNLSMRFDSDFVVRFAAAREIMRPRLDDLRVALSYGVNLTDNNVPIIRADGGNPLLRPYRANAVDLNFEKYFGNSGVIALQLFYKELESYIFNRPVPFNFSNLPPPAGAEDIPNLSPIGTISQPINTGDGELYGAELAVTLPFEVFTSRLEGFGVTGGVGYTENEVLSPEGNEERIPGYSKWVANATLFYERYGINARGSVRHRSSFLGDFVTLGGVQQRRSAKGETIIDAQIGYDFQPGSALDGLSVYIQGQNLTDEPFVSLAGDGDNDLQVIDYQQFGRRFLAGFTYRF